MFGVRTCLDTREDQLPVPLRRNKFGLMPVEIDRNQQGLFAAAAQVTQHSMLAFHPAHVPLAQRGVLLAQPQEMLGEVKHTARLLLLRRDVALNEIRVQGQPGLYCRKASKRPSVPLHWRAAAVPALI